MESYRHYTGAYRFHGLVLVNNAHHPRLGATNRNNVPYRQWYAVRETDLTHPTESVGTMMRRKAPVVETADTRKALIRRLTDRHGIPGKDARGKKPALRFGRVHEDGDSCTPCRRVPVYLDGQEIGELYREPGMLEWAGSSGVEEICSVDSIYGSTLAECKTTVREFLEPELS
ncbi:MAG: hypothetical protein OXF11_17335 [Deltaproteobacteria bacterium]|nr:hypothetical protein [Deltaproteobacteria bacterium]